MTARYVIIPRGHCVGEFSATESDWLRTSEWTSCFIMWFLALQWRGICFYFSLDSLYQFTIASAYKSTLCCVNVHASRSPTAVQIGLQVVFALKANLRTCSCAVMSNRYQIVVQGEASETDSDDEVYITSLPAAAQAAAAGAKVTETCLSVCLGLWQLQETLTHDLSLWVNIVDLFHVALGSTTLLIPLSMAYRKKPMMHSDVQALMEFCWPIKLSDLLFNCLRLYINWELICI